VSQGEWWRGMPFGLKLLFAFVAMPAWLVGGYCVLTGQNRSTAAYAAFAVFAAATLVMIIFDRRKSVSGYEGNGIDFGGD
jgi:hypothetical protein